MSEGSVLNVNPLVVFSVLC